MNIIFLSVSALPGLSLNVKNNVNMGTCTLYSIECQNEAAAVYMISIAERSFFLNNEGYLLRELSTDDSVTYKSKNLFRVM